MPWIDIGAADDFVVGKSREIVVAGRVIAVTNVEGTLHAMDGVCPHQGGPLGKGELTGCVLTCPWHGLQFDVRDGQSQLSPCVRHPTFAVKTENERVLVSVEHD